MWMTSSASKRLRTTEGRAATPARPATVQDRRRRHPGPPVHPRQVDPTETGLFAPGDRKHSRSGLSNNHGCVGPTGLADSSINIAWSHAMNGISGTQTSWIVNPTRGAHGASTWTLGSGGAWVRYLHLLVAAALNATVPSRTPAGGGGNNHVKLPGVPRLWARVGKTPTVYFLHRCVRSFRCVSRRFHPRGLTQRRRIMRSGLQEAVLLGCQLWRASTATMVCVG